MTFGRLLGLLGILAVLAWMGQQCSNHGSCGNLQIERVADIARWVGFSVVVAVFGFLLAVALIIDGFDNPTRMGLFLFLMVCNAIIWRSVILSAVVGRPALTVWEGFFFWVACGIVALWCGRVFYCTWGATMFNRDRC